MLSNIGLYSYGSAAVAYSLLTALVLITRRKESELGLPLIIAAALTAVWAAISAYSTLLPYPRMSLLQIAEVARNAAWSFLLLKLIAIRVQGTDHRLASNRWIPWFTAVLAGILAIFLGPTLVTGNSTEPGIVYSTTVFATLLAMAVLGLLLMEQIFRNSSEEERWSIKHLCLGLGVIFAYDFFMYAEGLLFRVLDATLWQSRGAVVAMAAAFLAVAAGRIDRSDDTRSLYVSRHVAFHSVTLLAAGVYLLMMAVVGYFIRYLGGSWGGVLQITFLCAAGLLMLVLLFSGQIRARVRVWLSKNFFSYKYDYRLEWLEFTQTLETGGDNIPESIIRAIGKLAKSPAGLLWSKTEENRYDLAASWEMPEPDIGHRLLELPAWLHQTEWIIDLREWRGAPDLYENLELPAFFEDISRAWLVIPLMFGEQLQGILLLRESDLQTELNWEDRDLLKVAGRQAASHLAQYQANKALIEGRQFEAFNRLSAYVIHDLKNILAQQSLMVSNAERHRDNPDFVDDMIRTVRNSVERMTRLMEQMRSGARDIGRQKVALNELLQEAVANRQHAQPTPTLATCENNLMVEADREHMVTVFTHVIQNAQEASDKNGLVKVRVAHCGDNAEIEIEDNGTGMSEEFVRDRLFKPFDSTKGLTGMGIGAFESREFVRTLGGDIRVTSTPGQGSLFRIVLPCTEADDAIALTDEIMTEGTMG